MIKRRSIFALLGGVMAAAIALPACGQLMLQLHSGSAVSSDLADTFQITNWSGSSSAGFARGCLVFKQGHVPAGFVPVITRAGSGAEFGYQFDARNTWGDGSLHKCEVSIRDAAFAGSATRTYNVTAAVGSFDNTSAGAITDITGSRNFTAAFSSVTHSDDSATAQHGSGAFTSSFNTLATVATRVTRWATGGVVDMYRVWGYATDDTGGAADAHLRCDWIVARYKNANGSEADIEYGCAPLLGEQDVANKRRLNYTAAIKEGSTTYYTYSSLQHIYHTKWGTYRTNDDNNEGRRPWLGAIPTLNFIPNFTYWINEAKILPPYDLTTAQEVPPTSDAIGITARYVPLHAANHRFDIDSVGTYIGRGVQPLSDVIVIMNPTAANFRRARVNALTGMHFPHQLVSSKLRIRPGDGGADISDTVVPRKMQPKDPSEYDFTAAGMPAATYCCEAYGFEANFVRVTGGYGSWSEATVGSAHAVNYSQFMYLMEADPWLYTAVITCANKTVTGWTAGDGNILPAYNYYTTFSTPLGIPSTPLWGGLTQIPNDGNARGIGWSFLLYGAAVSIVSDDDPQSGYVKLQAKHPADYAMATYPYFTDAQKASGIWLGCESSIINGLAMLLGVTYAAMQTEDANVEAFRVFLARQLKIAESTGNHRKIEAYIKHTMPITRLGGGSQPYDAWSLTNDFLPPAQVSRSVLYGTNSGNTFTYPRSEYAATPWLDLLSGMPLADGDIVWPTIYTFLNEVITLPTGMTHGQKYYIKNVTVLGNDDITFEFSTLANLSDTVTLSSNVTPYMVFALDAVVSDTETVAGHILPIADDFIAWTMADACMQVQAGDNDYVTARDNLKTYMSSVFTGGNFATWRMV